MLRIIADNPFRVLGLDATATYDDISLVKRKIESANKLGRVHQGVWQGEERLGVIVRTNPAVNTALTTLGEPIQRVRARLLWYHSNPLWFVSKLVNQNQSIQDIVLNHDLALNSILRAVQEDPRVYSPGLWHCAVEMWLACLENPTFWQYIWGLEQDACFPKAILETEFNDLRNNPPYLPLEIWLFLAKQFLDKHDMDGFLRLNNLARDSALGQLWDEEVLKSIIKPIEYQLGDSARQISDILGQVNRKNSEAATSREHNKKVADAAASILVLSIQPNVNRLKGMPGIEEGLIRWSQDLLATCLLDISNAYTWADEWRLSNYLLKESASWVEEKSALGLKVLRALKRRGI